VARLWHEMDKPTTAVIGSPGAAARLSLDIRWRAEQDSNLRPTA